MKTTFYCVHAQFFGYGKQTARTFQAGQKGKDLVDHKFGITGVKIWLADKEAAEHLAGQVNTGAFTLNDMLNTCTRNRDFLAGTAA